MTNWNDWTVCDSGTLAPFRLLPASINITQRNLTRDGYNKTIKDFYKINAQGQRCNPLRKHLKSDGHILFAGCSVTMGEGLFVSEAWPHMLYKKISKVKKLTGYFNVAQSGFTRSEVINQVFAYIVKYGVPELLFIGMPDAGRGIHKMSNISSGGFWDEETLKTNGIDPDIYVNNENLMLDMLRYIVESRGGKVYVWTWADSHLEGQYPHSNFKYDSTYLKLDDEELEKYVFENKPRDDKYWLTARDNNHKGTGYHQFWSKKLYEKFISDNDIIEANN